MGEKLVTENRRARHDYHILEKFEAGIELRGTEVKSLRAGQMTLKDSYADILNGQMYLVGAHISPYEKGNIYNHDPERQRRLLMHKREILRLHSRTAEKGLTLVPLRVYFKKGRAKVELALCRGKHHEDQRDTLREREIRREIDRALKNRQHPKPTAPRQKS
ncbi:MAG: SsrA-binding protein SmpB [Candidatus Hydrogenedentes bacterium]|nr:SsrA-binding protein SmpB [Candidatus Hydrogenedentota bacterium]